MPTPTIHLWYKAPFLRLILPLIAGILIQWYGQFPFALLIMVFCVLLMAVIIYHLLPLSKKFIFSSFNGVAITIL
ncbi:MAG TPA: hypothetical protein VNA26_08245, partial [Chitinophagaceae bacterium]|nr:hypothetical protein [Chitinophagaceae bacterium]